MANNFPYFPHMFTSSCIFWLHLNSVVFCSWVNLSDTEYLQNMMSSKIKLMGLLHAPLRRGRKAHFFYVFIILMIIRTSACWSSSRDNSYLPTILLNVACLWVKTKPQQPVTLQSCCYIACTHIFYKTYGSKSKTKYKILNCLGKGKKC